MSILNTLSSYERQNGAASYVVRGSASIKKYGTVNFEDLFTGDTPSIGAAAYVVGPINFLLRNAFEDVAIEGLDLEIEASEQSKSATLERVWIDGPRPKPGSTVTVKASIRTYRGEEITRSVPVVIPENARGSVSIMVTDGTRLSQVEARELQTPPLQTRDLPQMLRVLNQTRKNNRLYVRLLSSDGAPSSAARRWHRCRHRCSRSWSRIVTAAASDRCRQPCSGSGRFRPTTPSPECAR